MRIKYEQQIELPREIVWKFHENPEHLVMLHEGWGGFRMICHDGCVSRGCRTWCEAIAFGILPVAMGFEHDLYEPPLRFGEKMIHGPFETFRHIHEFEEGSGGTIVRDLLEIELPWYYGGELGMKLLIRPILEQTFRNRRKALLKLAESGKIG